MTSSRAALETFVESSGPFWPEEYAARASCLMAIQPRGFKPPFYYIPPPWGDVSACFELARRLKPDRPFYGLRPKALLGELGACTPVEEMAARFIAEICAIQPRGPYWLGGFSGGGIVAFEVARRLKLEGHDIARLIILDVAPPNVAARTADARTAGAWFRRGVNFIGNVCYWLHDDLLRTGWQRIALRTRTRVTSVIEKIGHFVLRDRSESRAHTAVPGFELSFLSELEGRQQSAQYRTVMEYVPCVFPGRITLMRARAQGVFGPHEPDLGWGPLTTRGVDVRVIPGSHEELLQEPSIRVLAKEFRACLD